MKKQRRLVGLNVSKNGKLVLVSLLLIVAIFSVLGYGFFSDFLDGGSPPQAPPADYATGYARIYLRDGLTRIPVGSDSIHLLYADNLTAWTTAMMTGTTFYTPASSLYWVNVSGYYPCAKTLYANGSIPEEYYNNTANIFKRANSVDISFHLISWQNMTSGLYNYSGILPCGDGYYRFEIRVSITGASRGISLYGLNQWVPSYLVPTNSWAAKLSLNFSALWFGWEGGIANYHLIQPQWGNNEIYEVGSAALNCTYGPNAWYDSDYIVEGYFINLQAIRLYDGLIDNWENYAGRITR